jgi:hypothetical protein
LRYGGAGYAIGKRPKKTVFLEWVDERRKFESPSDFAGVNVVRFDGGEESRRN